MKVRTNVKAGDAATSINVSVATNNSVSISTNVTLTINGNAVNNG
jgi:hypothetical protein